MSCSAHPLISVIIPTRERAETLFYTIATALDQKSNSYEVIVSDNFSNDDTRQVVQRFSDPRLKYFNTGRRLSMCDNWEFAIEQATGKYISVIGDDDAIIPGAIDKLQTFMQAHISQVYTWTVPEYNWPIDGQPASLVYLAPERHFVKLDLKKLASFVISMGGWKYYRIPSVYHSAIDKTIIDEIRKETGRVFHSTQPDVFTSMCIPVFVKWALHIGSPITVTGRSAKSNGGASLARNGQANVERYIREFGDYKIHSTLFLDVPTKATVLIPDAILVAMDKFPRFYGRMKFNYSAMWAFMCRLKLVSRWETLQNTLQIRKYHPFNAFRFLFYLTIQDISVLRRRMLNSLAKYGKWEGLPPDNIYDFTKYLVARRIYSNLSCADN